jgi:DNA-damage-inducible protein D
MEVRKTWEHESRFFSITDIIVVLVGTQRPKQYRTDLKTQLRTEGNELYGKIVQLKLKAADGKNYLTDCADTEAILRIVQSIPSPKAEPFKQRLAGVGSERVQEINDPEL